MTGASSKNPNMTLDTKNFIDAVEAAKAPPIYSLPYNEARKVLSGVQAGGKYNIDCDVHDVEFEAGTLGKLSVRIVKPKNIKEKLPIVMYYHGGGWVLGDKHTHDRLIREIAVGAKVAVVFVNYTPSPEAQYPVPIEQDYEALKYMATHADKYGLDVTRIAVAGDSVGGNMAAVMALKARLEKGPKIKCQVLIYPVTDAGMDTQSYSDFAEGPWLSKKAMEWFWDAYCPDKKMRKHITVSPLQATKDEMRHLPAALVITDENDVLRDEGEMYAQKLMEAGVDTVSVRYNGTVHDFLMLNALAGTVPARAALAQVVDYLKKWL